MGVAGEKCFQERQQNRRTNGESTSELKRKQGGERPCVCREVGIVHDSECMMSLRICKCGDDTKCECVCVCLCMLPCDLCVIYLELSGHGFR